MHEMEVGGAGGAGAEDAEHCTGDWDGSGRLLMLIFEMSRIGGSIPIVFSYFSEFLAQEKRGEHLSWLCMFWMIGGVYAAAMAWAIIPHYGKQGVSAPPSAPPSILPAPLCSLLILPLSARVEFPDGLSLPVPQLEGLCPRVCLSLGVCHRGSDHAAGESPLLPGGEWIASVGGEGMDVLAVGLVP